MTFHGLLNTAASAFKLIGNFYRRELLNNIFVVQPITIMQNGEANASTGFVSNGDVEASQVSADVLFSTSQKFSDFIDGFLLFNIMFNHPFFIRSPLIQPVLFQCINNGIIATSNLTSNRKNVASFDAIRLKEEILGEDSRPITGWFAKSSHKKNTSDSVVPISLGARIGRPLVKPLIRQLLALFIIAQLSFTVQDDSIVRSCRELQENRRNDGSRARCTSNKKHAIFIKRFPVWERLTKKQSNGISETGTVSYTTGAYDKLTFPIGVFATGRGVTFKEIAAVSAGGSPPAYSPELTEMSNGMVKLAQDLQYFILQGNASNSSGAGAATEKGVYNANGIDGFRGVLGSQGSFSGNGATQVDISSLNMTESLRFGATQAANNGGNPKLAFLSFNSKQSFDDEQMSNVRYQERLADLIPGTRVTAVTYADGEIMLIPFPGSTGGTYNRTSDNALVEDIYIVDDEHIAIPWLYSESFTILQLPSAVDNVLSSRWIIFGMYGLEIAAPSFNTKVRRLAS
ncbi:MAG: hypothetical protein AUI84_07060 [Delftia sp. 13_1_40CM_3_66_6]|nr:MAG: hypothetical protein AUI84_07060 [Delftia sp. 13_1_40CM_3_66_6]